ncbi:hypothetical protein PAMA_004450 [Pampus argenteus]
MLCSHGFQSALRPLMDVYWPAGSLWPEVKPLMHQQDLLQRNLQQILKETELFQTAAAMQPVSYQLEKEGEHFDLTLDTRGFSPEELSVRQVGSKLRVSGKTEEKEEDGKGSSSYRRHEFRQEFDLPEGLKHKAVTCFLAPDGKLHVQAARALCVEEAKRSLEEETQQSVCSHTEGDTQDKPGDMD